MNTSLRLTIAAFGLAIFNISTATVRGQDLSFLTNGLVAYYPLNGDAKDYSGYGNDGAVFGAQPTADRFGNLRSAYNFDGISSLITVPTTSEFDATNHSLCFWVNANSWTTLATTTWLFVDLLVKEDPTGLGLGREWVIQGEQSGQIRSALFTSTSGDAGYVFDTQQILSTGQWYHVVAVWDGIANGTFINGVFDSSVPADGSLDVENTPVRIGGSEATQQDFCGMIDDVRIYKRALSDTEVLSLYEYESNVNLTNAPPVITAQPRGKNLYVRDAAELQVVARGSWPLSFQWRKDGGSLDGKTNATLTLTNVSLTDTGDYTVVVSNVFGSVTSTVARVTVSLRGDYTYTTNNGTITITRYTGPGGDVTIPDTINGLPVTSIEDYAFESCQSLISVALPNTIRTIGGYAFYNCSSLTNGLVIPSGVTSIGDKAFSACVSLDIITISDSVTNIGNGAFDLCDNLVAINVDTQNCAYSSPDGVLFDKNQSICIQCPGGKVGTYTIPDTVTSIAGGPPMLTIDVEYTWGAFFGCSQLRLVNIPNTITRIAPHAFNGCGLSNITIPDSVTSIGAQAFFTCQSLTDVSIPKSVAGIGDWAFAECYSLTNVTIGKGVTSIGDFAFGGCASLTAITVDALNSSYSSVNGVLFDKSQSRLIQCPGGKAGTYTIPDGVTSIGDGAFEGCTSLTSVTIGNSVTNIGDAAFYRCTSLTSITIPNSVTSIGDSAFGECSSLSSVYFTGNAPAADDFSFSSDNNPTFYRLPGTTGWSDFSANTGLPTSLWFLPNPLILTIGPSFGVKTNHFGFIISWATNVPVVVEASTTLANPTWSPISTITLTNGSSYFSDPQWTNYTRRFYRIRSP